MYSSPLAQDPGAPTGLRPGADEAAKLAALRRTKRLATAALALCALVLIAARLNETRWPALAYLAAVAEAALIGGLADWYAVVALFRRPLGLPIPHTAIIPANQQRIADNLGRFIENNFLAAGPVEAKLGEVDFAAQVADWLSEEERAAGLAGFLVKLVPEAITAVEGTGLKEFVARRIVHQVEKLDVAPLAADLLAAVTADRRHQGLLDELLGALGDFLKDETAQALVREKIRAELPSLFNFFRADAFLLGRIVSSASSLIEDVRTSADHPLRREFDDFVASFVSRLRVSPEYAERAEKLKRDLLARPELQRLGENMWASLRAFIEQDAAQPQSLILKHLTGMLVDAGRRLAEEPQVRADMNRGFRVGLISFVQSQKANVSSFIADQVKAWDITQLVRLIEINIGRDLQYIRFNGMLIGGAAGLALHIAGQLAKTN